MTARLPLDLLVRPADESSRLLALHYLEEIELAERRLADPLDTEALHDFRVGLRRLRSCTRAYRAELRGSVSKQLRRKLRKLTLATNAGRDAEVHLGWLRNQVGRVGPEHIQGVAWLIGRLEGRQHETLDSASSDVGRRFMKLAAGLRPRLGSLRIEIHRGRGSERPSFRQVTGELIRRHAADLNEKLRAVRTAENMAEAHRARIAAKRLRYLLEPLTRRAAGAKGLIAPLKGLQDVLGQLHDVHVMSEEIATSLADLSRGPTDSSGAESGLRALEQAANAEGSAVFASFQARWGEQRGSRFFARADELGRTLASAAGNSAEGLPGLSLVPRRRSRPALNAEEEKPRNASATRTS